MRRRDPERIGPRPPGHLVTFIAADWPGAHPADCYDAFTAARQAWKARHPGAEMPLPPDAPFDESRV